MSKKINLIGKVVIAFVLTLTCMVVMLDSNALEFTKDLGITSEVKYSDEQDKATMYLNLETLDNRYVIEDIKDPEGTSMDLNHLQFAVEKNDTYIFDIVYSNKSDQGEAITDETAVDDVNNVDTTPEEPDEFLHYELKVDVDEIKESANEDNDEISVFNNNFNFDNISPASSQTNGSVTIDIPEYNHATGWTNGDVKTVNVTVDFGEDTSPNKKVEINVAQGLKYELISYKDGTNTTGVDSKILAPYTAGDPMIASTQNMTLPKKDTFAAGSTSGKINYELVNGAQKVNIKFNISTDMSLYYGKHTIVNGISVTATKNNGQVVGGSTVKQEVNAIGDPINNGPIQYYDVNGVPGTAKVLTSTTGNISVGKVPRLLMSLNNWNTKVSALWAKKVTFELYYPKGLEFSHIEGLGAYVDKSTAADKTAGRAVIEVDRWITRTDFWLYYKVPVGAKPGKYTVAGYDSVTYTWYDGKSKTNYRTGNQYSVEVVATATNALKIASSTDVTTDSTNSNYYRNGPQYIITNANAGTRTNQVAEFDIDKNWQVVQVQLPFDKSIAANKVKTVDYRTNLNNTWRTYTLTKDLYTANTYVRIHKSDLGLKENEYFTGVKANVGSFNSEYTTDSLLTSSGAINTYGRFDPSATQVTSAKVTFKTYDAANPNGTTETGERYVYKATTTLSTDSNASMEFKDKDGKNITGVLAGNTYKASMFLNITENTRSTVQVIANPEVYLRQIPGTVIDNKSIKVIDNNNKEVDAKVSSYKNNAGETIYKVATENCYVGRWAGQDLKVYTLRINYDVTTLVTASGVFNARDMVAWGKLNGNYSSTPSSSIPGFVDKHDFNGNKVYTDTVLSVKDNIFSIGENRNVLVETFLTVAGEDPKAPYSEDDEKTLAYFTPGTDADYIVNIVNNTSFDATIFTAYLPIPKTGLNFGSDFQSGPFKWDMKLNKAVTSADGFSVMYATTATAQNYTSLGIYKNANEVNLDNVNMLKIEITKPFKSNATAKFEIPLKVNETFESATEPGKEKVNTRNVYNPMYSVKGGEYQGTLPGTKVGAELIINEIGGIIFIDKDGDGFYSSGDELLLNQEVQLYIWSDSDKKYIPAKDKSNNNIVTKSKENGQYLFDHNYDLGKGVYALKFAEKSGYEFTAMGSGSSEVDSNVTVSGTNKGWIQNIDGTNPLAKSFGCGYLQYTADNDFSLSLPTDLQKIRVGENVTITPTITPNFWETIKGSPAYTWQLVNTKDSDYVTLNATNQKTLTISGKAKAPLNHEIPIKLTIKDIYGNSKTAEINVQVNTNVAPTVTGNEIYAYVDDNVDLVTGIKAVDDYGVNIPIFYNANSFSNTVIEGDKNIDQKAGKYTKAATYKLIYKVEDIYGNTGTLDRIVKVNGLPFIEADPQMYDISETDIKDQVQKAGNAYYEKASNTENTAPDIISITMKDIKVDGPSDNFSKTGKYKVTYSAENSDKKTVSKTVDVIIMDGLVPGDSEEGVNVHAQYISLSRDELSMLTKEDIISKSKAQAIYYKHNDQNILTDLDDITSLINVKESLDEIKNAPASGGVYKLTLAVAHKGFEDEIEINVFVEGTDVKHENGLVITANDFSLTNAEAIKLSEQESLDKSNVKAYVLKTHKVIDNINTNQNDLKDINDVGFDGDVFNITFTATADSKSISITKEVTVEHSKVLPTVLTDVRNHYVGEEFEEIVNVKATDAGNNKLKLTSDNTEVIHSIPLDKGNYKDANTYEITVKVADKYNNIQEVKQIVKVNGMPVIEVNPQVYKVSDKNIDEQVKKAGSAYYFEASETVKEPPTQTPLDLVKYDVKGPTQDFSEIGNYNVTYKATTKDGRESTKTVVIVITKDVEIPDDRDKGIVLDAYNFAITQDELLQLNENDAIERANAQAFYYEKNSIGEISNIIPLDDEITTSSLEEIKNASKDGGEYTLTYLVSYEDEVVEKTISVVVAGEQFVVEHGVVINANDIVISNANASSSNEDNIIEYSNASAYVLETKEVLTPINVDQDVLNDIQATSYDAVTYQLPLHVVYDNEIIEIIIKVDVEHTLIPPELTTVNEIYYVGDDYIKYRNVSAVDVAGRTIEINKDTTKETHTIPLENGKYSKPGTYQVDYEVKDIYGDVSTANKVVQVHGLPEIAYGEQIYGLNDKNLLDKIKEHPTAGYHKASEVLGETPEWQNLEVDWKVVNGPYGDISLTKAGVYRIEYTATNEDQRMTKEIASVMLLHSGTIPPTSSDLYISAKGFGLGAVEARNLDEFKVMQEKYADVDAFKVKRNEKNEMIDSVSMKDRVRVNEDDLDKLKSVKSKGGIYTLEFILEDNGEKVSRNINVVVVGKNTPPIVETPDGNGLAISAENFILSNEEAKQLDEATAIDKANVKAILLQPEMQQANVRMSISPKLEIRADKLDLDTIRNIDTIGGTSELTFYVDYYLNNKAVAVNMIEIEVKIDAAKPIDSKKGDSSGNDKKTPPIEEQKDGVDTSDKSYQWYLIIMLVTSLGYQCKAFASMLKNKKED